jgi:hypothetical protein
MLLRRPIFRFVMQIAADGSLRSYTPVKLPVRRVTRVHVRCDAPRRSNPSATSDAPVLAPFHSTGSLEIEVPAMITMNRPDYEAAYRRLRGFIECTAHEATQSVGPCGVNPTTEGTPCYKREGANLALCAECLLFWRECSEYGKYGDPTTWQIAVSATAVYAITTYANLRGDSRGPLTANKERPATSAFFRLYLGASPLGG